MNIQFNQITSLLIACSSIIQIQAQDTTIVSPGQLDSLERLISISIEDTNKVILLNEYARLCFYDLNYLSGLSATKEARNLAKKLRYRNGEPAYFKAISYFHRNTTLGAYFLIMSDWQSNEGLPQDALTGASSHPFGLYDRDLGKIQKQLFLAFNAHEKAGDEEIMANLFFAIFQNYRALGHPDQSDIYWDLSYQAFMNLGQPFPSLLLLVERISFLRITNRVDSARQLELEAISLVDQAEDLKLKGLMFFVIGNHYLFTQGRFNLALEYYLKSVDALKEIEGGLLYMQLVNLLGATYSWLGNNEKAIFNFEKVLKYYRNKINAGQHLSEGIELQMVWTYTNIADPLVEVHRFREADEYLDLALPIAQKYNASIPSGRYYQFKARVANREGRYDQGLAFNLLAIEEFEKLNVSPFLSEVSLSIGRHYQRLGDLNKALHYGLKAYEYGLSSNRSDNAINASLEISEFYEQAGQTQKANEFLKTHLRLRDENDALNAAKRFEDAELKTLLESQNREIATLEKDKILQDQEQRNQRLWLFSISGALISAIILAIILYRNAQSKKKANTLLNQQKDEIERTLNQLKATQAQLIQSEKMASLGELTAGIAHEIQNPLNFVNNFSELNEELITELRDELKKGNVDEAVNIAEDLFQNEEKIKHHGKRAEGIVKSMLQHSSINSGQKEITDINALCEEYLRLAYHGMRAKDKSFKVEIKSNFDADLPPINVVPQDIGRVFLNLINNAFQACTERSRSACTERSRSACAEQLALSKSKGSTGQSKLSDLAEPSSAVNLTVLRDYKPLVSVTTKFFPLRGANAVSPLRRTEGVAGMVQISITDNGAGISEEIKDKIFQPFFTTKPTGEGTGLGLSLSYDIVKAHGGEIKVHSKEGAGTTFVVEVPVV